MVDDIVAYRLPRAKGDGARVKCLWCCLLLALLMILIGWSVFHLLWERAAMLSRISAPPTPAPSVSAPPTPAPSVSAPPTPAPSVSAPPTPTSPVSTPSTVPLVFTLPIPLPTGNQIELNNANFTIDVPRDRPEIRVCVRDHSCEDGDRIRLLVNQTEVYKGEIYTVASCVLVPVNVGENNLQLYAINGTGGKGNCSYEPINTGQIVIQSINWESARWGLSPGSSAFSKVNIVLK